MSRRSKLEVFADILKVVAEEREIRRTRVMYKANLAWKVLKESLDILETRGIVASEERPSGVFLSLTQEGHNALRRFSELESMFESPGPIIENRGVMATALTARLY